MKHWRIRAATREALLALLATGLMWAGGCSSARRSEPLHGPLPVTEARASRLHAVLSEVSPRR
jgi:hypothetical protein